MLIGFSDIVTRNAYAWANGVAVTYTARAPGQPDHWVDGDGNEEHCTELRLDTLGWNDIRCAHELRPSFVCESL